MTDDMPQQDRQDRERDVTFQHYSRTALWRLRTRRYVLAVSSGILAALASWGKRGFDLCLSAAFILILSPLLVAGFLLSGLSFQRSPRVGRWLIIFDELSFRTDKGWAGRIVQRSRLQRLPVLINILKGDMSFVGPLPVSPGDLSPRQRDVRKRYNVRPGLISLWWIRQRANIDYGTEIEADAEYVDNHGILRDIGISLRAVPAILYGGKVSSTPNNVTVLGIAINNITMDETLDAILAWLDVEGARQICFVNADCANIAYRNSAYKEVLNKADLSLADGIGVKLAGKILAQEIKQNVNGTDLFPLLCEKLSGGPSGIFLLGARASVVEGVVEWIHNRFPLVHVCGWHDGYFSADQESDIIRTIRDSGAHLLLVALGAPKQDIWIHENLKETGVRVAMGVGGLFDFYSGRIPRAPLWMREIGMEWLFRLAQEPGRLWKRYLIGNGLFLWRVLRERMSSRDSDYDGTNKPS